MTTLEPGATEVLTHGLAARPLSTALRASSAAASITEGLDVLVQDVIEAMETAPWSSSNSRPSAVTTCTGVDGRPWAPLAADSTLAVSVVWESAWVNEGGSEAGKDSSRDSSTLPSSMLT
ncbi:hypothetical protein D9M72_385240 [compost metagenome]